MDMRTFGILPSKTFPNTPTSSLIADPFHEPHHGSHVAYLETSVGPATLVLVRQLRLRQSPDVPPPAPRRVKPMPTPRPILPAVAPSPSPAVESSAPSFPPPHVALHADDANSKVFLAIGRALMAVVSAFPFSYRDAYKCSLNHRTTAR